MRKKLSIYNSIAGLMNIIVSMIFIFLVRHFFTTHLHTDYLGLEGLFANVLGLFSLMDLGLGTAISFNLYGPIHDRDREGIASIMKLYKNVYYVIGTAILLLALLCCPILPFIVKESVIRTSNIQRYFILYAFSVGVTYFFSHKRTLIFALQKNYIVLLIDSAAKMVLSILQIIVLIRFQDYALYLVCVIFMNLLCNIFISFMQDRIYPLKKNAGPIEPALKEKLKTHIKTLAITNVSWQGIHSTDNVIISAMIGLTELSKNANYSVITSSLVSIVTAVLGGVSASIGDLLVEKDEKKIKDYFDRYCFIYTIVASYVTLGYYFVSKAFVSLWVGNRFLFSPGIVGIISVNLFLTLIFRPLADYQNYSGNFIYYKPYSVVALLLNIVGSILLAKLMGIKGVFLGTTVTYIFMISAVVLILYKHLFHQNAIKYLCETAKTILPLLISFGILILLEKKASIHFNNLISEILAKGILVTVVYFILLTAVLRRNRNYIYFRQYAFSLIRRRREG